MVLGARFTPRGGGFPPYGSSGLWGVNGPPVPLCLPFEPPILPLFPAVSAGEKSDQAMGRSESECPVT